MCHSLLLSLLVVDPAMDSLQGARVVVASELRGITFGGIPAKYWNTRDVGFLLEGIGPPMVTLSLASRHLTMHRWFKGVALVVSKSFTNWWWATKLRSYLAVCW
jgi:hypothetical protein